MPTPDELDAEPNRPLQVVPADVDEDDDDLDEAAAIDVAAEREEQRRLWLSTLASIAALPAPPEDADTQVQAEFRLTLISILGAIRRVLIADLPGER